MPYIIRMEKTVQAVYEVGVLRPLEPILPELPSPSPTGASPAAGSLSEAVIEERRDR